MQLLNQIEEEAELWCQAGAKALSILDASSFQDQACRSARTWLVELSSVPVWLLEPLA